MRKVTCSFLSLFVLASCSKENSRNFGAPESAVLLQPAANEACTNGKIVTNETSIISFKWNASDRTEKYELHINNLEKSTELTLETTSTSMEVPLESNQPYSWYIISRSSRNSAEGRSETRRFYNSGEGKTSYAPFPAEIVAPFMGQILSNTNGKVSLDWTGSDADNDLSAYDVYFGTGSNDLAPLKTALTESILTDVEVQPGNTYFWKIISRDLKGNTASSGVYQFDVK